MSQPLLKIGANSANFCNGGKGVGINGGDCNPWLNHLMEIFAAGMFLGGLMSFLIPETKGKTLEELAGEAGGAEADRLTGGRNGEGGGSRGRGDSRLGSGRGGRKRRRGEWLLGRGHGSDGSRSTRYEVSVMSEGTNLENLDGKTVPSTGWNYRGWNPDNIPLQDVGKLIG